MTHVPVLSHSLSRRAAWAAIGLVSAATACSGNSPGSVPPVAQLPTKPAATATTSGPLGVIRDPSLVDVAERTGTSSTAFGIQLPSRGPLMISFACAGGQSASVQVGNFANTVPCSGEPSTDEFGMTAGRFVVQVQAHGQRWRLLLQRRP